MPVSESNVIDLSAGYPVDGNEVRCSVVFAFVLPSGEPLHTPMDENDTGLVCRQIRIDGGGAEPSHRVATGGAAQERAGQDDGRLMLDRRRLQQYGQVGSKRRLLAAKELLLPDAPRTSVIVVAGDHEDRQFDPADRAAGSGHGRFVRAGRVKEIARHEDESRLGIPGNSADALDHVHPGLSHQ